MITRDPISTTVDNEESVLFVEHKSPVPVKSTHEVRAGDLCPKCKEERLDYDGLLNLTCPNCGYALGGCFT